MDECQPLKLGRASRNRKVGDRAAAALRSVGFMAPRVLHLLGDREQERTVAAQWCPPVPPPGGPVAGG